MEIVRKDSLRIWTQDVSTTTHPPAKFCLTWKLRQTPPPRPKHSAASSTVAEAGVLLMKPVSLPPSGPGFSAWFVREMLTSDRNRLGYNSPAACGPQCRIFTVGTTGHCPWVFHGPRESRRSWFTWPHDATSLYLSLYSTLFFWPFLFSSWAV